MQVLKSFVDGQGRRMKPGADLPTDYDSVTLKHYQRYGMVGEALATAKPVKGSPAKAAKGEKAKGGSPGNPDPAATDTVQATAQIGAFGPSETKPAGPDETKAPVNTDADPAA
ncbi:hypothetical protein SAMN05216344_106119 [Polaromonas sp. OV174]|uniref:hypothetical protein n=1 Tax=Polaromonas sp. OV174 TaxID=1855300 RepID=UPI0008E81A7D|nr:hypothetical protein [Polaromonas sp. OV174]SFB96565.1 hypothetical protein SAMN05216344_106119 [Polaromonas sp. OV174]